MTLAPAFRPGSLVRARGREWVVLPETRDSVLRLRPLGGSDEDATAIYLPLEPVKPVPATFPPPDPAQPGSQTSALLLRDALRLPDVLLRRGGFDVVLGNPPWETMSPDAKEWFAPYDPTVREMAPEQQKERIAELLSLPGLQDAWDAHCRTLYRIAAFMKESGRYRLFAQGNLGKGDFNVYRMFVETAMALVRPRGVISQIVPENFYNGANASAIRSALFCDFHLKLLAAFENTRRIWFPIDSTIKFCLYVAECGGPTECFAAIFRVNSLSKISDIRIGRTLVYPVAQIREFSPEALAIAEVLNPADVSIVEKLYARLPRFGENRTDLACRQYMAEVHMGNDRENFGGDSDGVPLYQGSMISLFDHRAKAYREGHGTKAKWDEIPFGDARKRITPQWRISIGQIPEKAKSRIREFRLGFCDVGKPGNQRLLMAALIPAGAICGDKVPTITFEPKDARLSMLWLGVANALCMDFLARRKVSLKVSLTVMDSLPLPRSYSGMPVEQAIAARALRLSATGPEMEPFWTATAPMLGLDPRRDTPSESPAERERLRTELDVLVARDLFGLMRDEMRYLLDPADILGPDCGFETFGALQRAERKAYGEFRTRHLILEAWDRLPSPAASRPIAMAGS